MSEDDVIEMSNEVLVAVSETARKLDQLAPTLPAATQLQRAQSQIMGVLGDVGRTPGCKITDLATWPEATRDELVAILSGVMLMFGRNRVLAREALMLDRDLFYGWIASTSFREWELRLVDQPALIADIQAAAHRRIGEVLAIDAKTTEQRKLQMSTARFVVVHEREERHHADSMELRRRQDRRAEETHARENAPPKPPPKKPPPPPPVKLE